MAGQARAGADTIRLLAERIRQVESVMREPASASASLGTGGLADLFPGRALPRGALIELVAGAEGAGAWTLSLSLARLACDEARALLVADHQHWFYPPAAWRTGLDQRRLVIVRSRDANETLLALCQSLRCPAIGAAMGRFDRLGERDSRRLQLAVEAGGGIGVLVRPHSARAAPSFATLRLLLNPMPSCQSRRRVRIEVLRCRGGRNGRSLVLEIDDETGAVHSLPGLAPAAGTARSTG